MKMQCPATKPNLSVLFLEKKRKEVNQRYSICPSLHTVQLRFWVTWVGDNLPWYIYLWRAGESTKFVNCLYLIVTFETELDDKHAKTQSI